ncbi:MAG: PilT/PilU family type 4a pilus ATPase [Acidobacteria bacterium]|nr:PilT/PilU family type 4a pilus ATPase [Acidobacteriota bacterium]
MDLATFNRLLSAAAKGGASDIHFKSFVPPAVRINGTLNPVKCPALAPEDMDRIAGHLLAQVRFKGDPGDIRDFDSSYTIEGVARFRVSLFRQMGHFASIIRVIPFAVPTFEQLGAPAILEKITQEPRGLVLVTGVTGSGKTSTLAAMVDYLNSREKLHILTIEDPIEFLHQDKLSRITQRELGIDTPNFPRALRAGLRQDPDVILVGEMRDIETIETALTAAETGHLVLGTLHTTDAGKSIGRILGAFPNEAQHSVRLRLAETLRAIISQRLLPHASGKGRVLAAEILVSTLAVQTMIREPEKMGALRDYLEQGGSVYGTQSFDQHLLELLRAQKITGEVALSNASNAADMQRILMLEG